MGQPDKSWNFDTVVFKDVNAGSRGENLSQQMFGFGFSSPGRGGKQLPVHNSLAEFGQPALHSRLPKTDNSLFGATFDSATKHAFETVLAEVTPKGPDTGFLGEAPEIMLDPKHPTSPYPENIDDILDSTDLYGSVEHAAISDSKPIPEYGTFPSSESPPENHLQLAIPRTPPQRQLSHPNTSTTPIHRSSSLVVCSSVPTTPQSKTINPNISNIPHSSARPKNMFEIRNINPHAKKAFSAMMGKMGANCNMRFNEEKQCWEGNNEENVSQVGTLLSNDDAEVLEAIAKEQPTQQIIPIRDDASSFGNAELVSTSGCGNRTNMPFTNSPKQLTKQKIFREDLLQDLVVTDAAQGLSFLNGIEQAMDSLANIRIPPEIIEPSTLNNLETTIHADSRQEEKRTVVASSKTTCNFAQHLKSIVSDEATWPDLFELNLDDANLLDVSGLSSLVPNILRLSMNANSVMHLNGLPRSLATLIANNNRISNMTSFVDFQSLKYMDISRNNLSDIYPLRPLTNLRELNISGNLITEVFLKNSEFPSLYSLDISRNALKSVIMESNSCRNLQSLYIDSNSIEYIRISSQSLCKIHLEQNKLSAKNTDNGSRIKLECNALKILNIGMNLLDKFDASWVPEKCGIENLYLHEMKMDEGMIFSQFKISLYMAASLRSINVSGTPLETLDLFIPCINLQSLSAKGCNLREISSNFAMAMNNLKTLKLSFNNITDISTIKPLQALTTLSLAHNKITRFRPTISTLLRLRYLESLDLRYNPITNTFYPAAAQPTSFAPEPCQIVQSEPMTHAQRKIQCTKTVEYTDAVGFVKRDALFRKKLADDVFVKRLCYRSLLSRSNLRILDGLVFEAKEREKAEECMRLFLR